MKIRKRKLIKKILERGVLKSAGRVIGSVFYRCYELYYKSIRMKNLQINERQILFYSTPSFSDNGKVLFSYLQEAEKDEGYQFIWLIHREDKIPKIIYKHTLFIRADSYYHKGFSMKALKAVATSKFVLFTHSSPTRYMPKIEDQVVVNLWHGCGYKDIQNMGVEWIKENPFDLALVPGSIFVETKARFWRCDKNLISVTGYPRYDLFYKENKITKEKLFSLKGNAKKIIIWMPTFRNTGNDQFPEELIEYSFELPLISSLMELDKLNQKCLELEIVLCLKRHPKQVKYSCEKKYYSNIMFIDNRDLDDAGIELYSLLRYTDALISDYSSVAIDYLLLNKPIAFTLDDFDEYKNTRGFVFSDPLRYMPGHHLYSFEDILIFIQDVAIGADPYKEDRMGVMPEVHISCDNYCKFVWETIVKQDKETNSSAS